MATLARNTAYLTISKTFSVAVYAVFGLVLPRLVSLQQNGVYTLMSTLLFFGSMAATFGVPTILIRSVAREPERGPKLFSDARRALHIGALLSAFLILCYLFIEMAYHGEFKTYLVVLGSIVAAIIFFDAMGGLGEALFQSREEMVIPAVFDILTGIVRAGGATICLYVLPEQQVLMGIFACFLLGSIIRAVFLTSLVKRQFASQELPPTSNKDAWRILKESFGVAVFRLMRMLRNRFDALLLGFLIVPAVGMSLEMSADLVRGFYGTAMRVVFVFHTLTVALNTAIYPRIARLAENEDQKGEEFRRVVRYQAWWVAPLAVAVFVWAEQLAGWFGNDYRFGIEGVNGTTADVLKILAGATLLDCIGGPVGMLLVSSKKMDHKLPFFGASLAVVSIGMNILLIPRYGMIGAAWASVCAAFVEFFMKARYAKIVLGNYQHLLQILPYVVIAGIVGLIANYFFPYQAWAGLGAGLVAYIMLSYICGLIDPGITGRLSRAFKNGQAK